MNIVTEIVQNRSKEDEDYGGGRLIYSLFSIL